MTRDQRSALLMLGAGAVVVLLATARPWLTGTEVLPAPLPSRDVRLGAGDVAPGVRAVGLLGLAGVLAVVAARGRLRSAVGALLAVAGGAVVLQGLRVLLDPVGSGGGDTTGLARSEGPVLALAGGLLLLTAGVLTALRGRQWDSLGRRYDAPTAPRPPAESDLWAALDRGEDPTGLQDPPASGTGPRD